MTTDRPTIKSVICELEISRETAETLFKSLVFEPGEETVIVTEILRPTKPGEQGVFYHTGAGQNFCVDRYELDGVPL